MIPCRSISWGLACPTAPARAHLRIGGTSRPRFSGAMSLESRSPAGIRPQAGSMTTTPTLTGPASAPRPTSSMPATSVWPSANSCRSRFRVGAGVIAASLTAGDLGERLLRVGEERRVVEGPDDHPRGPDDVAFGHESPTDGAFGVARGVGAGAVIAEQPEVRGRVGDGEFLLARFRTRVDVGLVDRGAVDEDPPLLIAALHRVSRHPDDAFDEVFVRVLGQQAHPREGFLHDRGFLGFRAQPPAGIDEDDDVPALE